MKRILFFTLVIFSLFILLWGSGSDEDRLKNEIKDISELLSYNQELHPFEQLQRSKQVGGRMASDCQVILLTTEGKKKLVSDRAAIERKLLAFYRVFDEVRLTASDIKVQISGEAATVRLLGRGTGRKKGEAQQFLEEHRIMLSFALIEDEWFLELAQNEVPLDIPRYDE